MRILDVTEFYSQRGGGVRSHLTVKNHILCQLGHEHRILAPGPVNGPLPDPPSAIFDGSVEPPKTDLTESKAATTSAGKPHTNPVHFLKAPSLPYDPSYHLLYQPWRVLAEARAFAPDVFEIHSPYVAALSGKLATRAYVKTFVWHADFIDTYLRVALEKSLPARGVDATVEPLWAWVRSIARSCDATICGAKWQVEKLERHGVERVVYLPFGVDKTVFNPARCSEEKRAELLQGSTGPLLLGIGRFAVEKRMDIVLDAFACVRRSLPDARLVLFGDGPDRNALERQAAAIGHVHFAGFSRDRIELATAMASADVLLHGCPYETFGLGVAEALATGLPGALPDEGGAAELARPSFAAVYKSLDAEAGGRAALSLLQRNPAQKARGVAEALQVIGSERDHFEQLLGYYTEFLARKRHKFRVR